MLLFLYDRPAGGKAPFSKFARLQIDRIVDSGSSVGGSGRHWRRVLRGSPLPSNKMRNADSNPWGLMSRLDSHNRQMCGPLENGSNRRTKVASAGNLGALVQVSQWAVGVVVADVGGLGKSSRSVGIDAPARCRWENDLVNRKDVENEVQYGRSYNKYSSRR
jgi:hypothetical protein